MARWEHWLIYRLRKGYVSQGESASEIEEIQFSNNKTIFFQCVIAGVRKEDVYNWSDGKRVSKIKWYMDDVEIEDTLRTNNTVYSLNSDKECHDGKYSDLP